jgi:hypothetical protein
VREVQHRIHDLIGIPEAFGESLYVLQYSHGQKYDVHTDHCSITVRVSQGERGGLGCQLCLQLQFV